MMDSKAMYAAATKILTDCTHDVATPCLITMTDGTSRHVCCDCWNLHVAARRAARKVQLSEGSIPCETGCGRRTTKTLRGVNLCGRCCTKACTKLNRQVQNMGWLALGGMTASRETILANAR